MVFAQTFSGDNHILENLPSKYQLPLWRKSNRCKFFQKQLKYQAIIDIFSEIIVSMK